MNQQQINERGEFVSRLKDSGWNAEGWDELFEGGVGLSPEAQAEYHNDQLDLRLSWWTEKRYVLMDMVSKNEEMMLSVQFHPRGDLGAVIDAIVARQNNLSAENYVGFIETMVPMCDSVFVETPNGLVRVS